MIRKEKIKIDVENTDQAMWAISDVWNIIDVIFDSIGTCSDCKHRYTYNVTNDGICFERADEWFCADFERKDQ